MTVADPGMLSGGELYGVFNAALYSAVPALRNLKTSHWEMGLDWYLALRRVSLPPELPDDDPARDESKWVPDPEDMVLGYTITVTEAGGAPYLVNDDAVAGRTWRAEELHA